ncbi:hypothetical protein J2I47_17480 [Fibrella sp. HMF5335]|uniref:ABC-three component systems C-terminal domain-containing protein n=1 Tax=Fibrella rubiginis TaxID=2817060 RepID=A0A939K2M0_9BACT|nr:ABC-three component system protein [Fibrella rubiginis]MBO0938347.1 hypothetical protein [Fibrella rubiginis]
MNTPFSAGPQAIGYLYQARYSLYELLSQEQLDSGIRIECLDDISVETTDVIKLDQLKHHVKKSVNITDSSVELWKTIRVWSDSLLQGKWRPEDVTLSLITTASAVSGSAAEFLRPRYNRNEEKALTILLEISRNSSNKNLKSSFDSFRSLTNIQQRRLIKSIHILDDADNIRDIVSKIKLKLSRSAYGNHIDSLYERLEGWWFDKVVEQLLADSSYPIMLDELNQKIVSISEQFKRDSLPIDYALEEPELKYFTNKDDRVFVHQLNHIKINAKRVRFAILDYYRAFEQRSRWTRESLIIDDELINYEKRLKEEWERCVANLEDGMLYQSKDDDCIMFGREVFNWMESSKIPIRNNMPISHEYVTRGSFHMLADLDPPSVYWHPKFLGFLENVININESK